MLDQTPVQLAWVTPDSNGDRGRFANVRAPDAGVPRLDIDHVPPTVRAYFDYVKQEQR